MSRPLLPVTTILALVTALILLAAAVAVRLPESLPAGDTVDASAADLASRAVVERFYAAVNHAIATGDPTSLDAILSPDYAERDGTGELVPGREPLERSLQALHETAPGLRLAAEAIVAEEPGG